MKRFVVSVRTHLREQYIITAVSEQAARDVFSGSTDFDTGPTVSQLEEYDIVNVTEIPFTVSADEVAEELR